MRQRIVYQRKQRNASLREEIGTVVNNTQRNALAPCGGWGSTTDRAYISTGCRSALLPAEKASPCPTSSRHVPFGPATRYVPAYWASISFPVVEEPRSALGPSRAGHRGGRTVSGNVLPGNGCAWHGQASELWGLCAGGNRITRTCRFPDPQQRPVRFPEDTRPRC